MLIQPAGRPASMNAAASKPLLNGVRSDGLRTTAQPAANDGATLWQTRLSGKLNGVMAATMPTGIGTVNPYTVRPSGVASNCTVSEGSRRASSAATDSVVIARSTSASA